jgi:hypothetical protein
MNKQPSDEIIAKTSRRASATYLGPLAERFTSILAAICGRLPRTARERQRVA